MSLDVKRVKEAAQTSVYVARAVNAWIDRICEAAHPRGPQEAKSTAAGVVTGMAAGAVIGGVGLAALGGAIGVPGAALLAFLGGPVGNRIGISRDRKARRLRPKP